MLLTFEPKSFGLENIPELSQYARYFPLWIGNNQIPSNFPNVLPAMELANKPYGLDEVFERVKSENYLLDHDFDRLKFILTEAFANQQVDNNQKIYLQRKYKNIKREHPNTFTDLYMNNLLHLVEHLHEMNNPEFLPDLQKIGASCSKADLGMFFLYSHIYICSLILSDFR